jgi:hypothetical protein
MERSGGELSAPSERVAHVAVRTVDGAPVLDRLVRPADEIALPTGSKLRLDALGFYARLSVVDDPTIPLLYGALGVALVGLALVTVARQQLVLVTVVEGETGPALVAKLRLWRNVSTNREEIGRELAKALRAAEEEKVS